MPDRLRDPYTIDPASPWKWEVAQNHRDTADILASIREDVEDEDIKKRLECLEQDVIRLAEYHEAGPRE